MCCHLALFLAPWLLSQRQNLSLISLDRVEVDWIFKTTWPNTCRKQKGNLEDVEAFFWKKFTEYCFLILGSGIWGIYLVTLMASTQLSYFSDALMVIVWLCHWPPLPGSCLLGPAKIKSAQSHLFGLMVSISSLRYRPFTQITEKWFLSSEEIFSFYTSGCNHPYSPPG